MVCLRLIEALVGVFPFSLPFVFAYSRLFGGMPNLFHTGTEDLLLARDKKFLVSASYIIGLMIESNVFLFIHCFVRTTNA
ncbi:hypothetical protein BDZ91DRAFT_5156 [Kalaharituber pfeilii]|nr:hypothetical protein BDZ91DRAFT_5156 [Kalaharituber pfeilii]